jgi:hypothetical protein
LTIKVTNKTYTAAETLRSVAQFEIIQNNDGGFTGNNVELKPTIQTLQMKPLLLYKYNYSNQVRQNFYADEDTFFKEISFSVYHKVMI